MTTDITSRKLRMVMIGGGPGSAIGGVHRRAANLDGQYDLVGGAFSTDETRSHAMGRELFLDPARVTASWRDLLDRERTLPLDRRADVVSIVTPNHLHFEQATAALELGFHVIMDKPMTMTLDEAYRLRDTVRESGKVFALTHPYAAGAMVKLARDLVAKGVLGVVRRVVVEYPQGWLARRIEADNNRQALWRTDPALAGSGCVGDIGTHAANLSETVTGMRIVSVSADVGTVVEGRRLDDDFSVHARWENGARGSIQASQISSGEGDGLSIRVYGTDAGLEWRHDTQDFLLVRHQQKPWEKWARGTDYVAAMSPAAARVTRTDQYHPEGYIEEFANIYLNAAAAIRAVDSGHDPTPLDLDFPNVEDGIRGMSFIQATLKSARLTSTQAEVMRVALYLNLAQVHHQGIAQGVIAYFQGRESWELFGAYWPMSEVGDLDKWDGDGIIAAVESEAEGAMLVSSGLPVVDVSGGARHPAASLVSNGNVDIGAMAGDYFLGNGFLHFACCAAEGSGWSEERVRGFTRATEAKRLGDLNVFSRPMSWWHSPEFSRELADFLAMQSRPLALFAANDIIGLNVVGSCRLAGLRVPEDVAIVGVDNEELLCNLSRPALSSIAFDRHEIGRQVARCLEQLIAAGRGKPTTIRIPPVQLVERASSAVVPVADPLVIQALSLIRRDAVKGLSASDVVKGLFTSRRNLERRFSRAMGCSILAKIHKTRVEYAKTLLREGDLPVAKVAALSGFASINRFSAAFSKYAGMSPREYPKRQLLFPEQE